MKSNGFNAPENIRIGFGHNIAQKYSKLLTQGRNDPKQRNNLVKNGFLHTFFFIIFLTKVTI